MSFYGLTLVNPLELYASIQRLISWDTYEVLQEFFAILIRGQDDETDVVTVNAPATEAVPADNPSAHEEKLEGVTITS
eukprot:CAMPEP_0181206216 /NCGR_PEP_ID=MMETSP1096-20121128/20914_1 /TAXON_ID=156174 ORGANISM="Chrysochromulina ericina, Strain CCMP281" /NCGR_SAMPLE_ID=MMETSP1096 /ASSEMBLY_ACC=CAM_ASM_000453 /LENGTH=77 /DNA_ID=CAMNT_0023297095 /DNA_START=64 /DNA_END=297 /DNA_ORIENTATION=-